MHEPISTQGSQEHHLRTRTSEVEREADKYVGRVPVETGNRRQPFACVAVTDKRLRNGKYPTIYHGLQELEQKVPQTVDARGSSVADPNQPATSGELYSLSAMCAQQLTQDECESTDQLKVTPFGNYGRRTPHSTAPSWSTRTPVSRCAPKRIEQVLEPEAKQWYYGSAANPGGFLEHERMLVEKFRQKHAKDYRHPNVISDADLRASRDLEREMEIINSMSSGIRRFSVPAKSRPRTMPTEVGGDQTKFDQEETKKQQKKHNLPYLVYFFVFFLGPVFPLLPLADGVGEGGNPRGHHDNADDREGGHPNHAAAFAESFHGIDDRAHKVRPCGGNRVIIIRVSCRGGGAQKVAGGKVAFMGPGSSEVSDAWRFSE